MDTYKARFKVVVNTPHRRLMARECQRVEEIIRDAIDEHARSGGMGPEDIDVEITGPHSFIRFLAKGTRIRIRSGGHTIEGFVDTAQNFGSVGQDDWYIEGFVDGDYFYWKQQIDGGTMEVLDAED